MRVQPWYVFPLAAAMFRASVALGEEVQAIYTDGLAGGWADWSWNTTRNFNNTSPVHGAGGKSIAVTHTSAWGGLYLHTNITLNKVEYTAIRFSIHGGAGGGHTLQLLPYDAAGNGGTRVPIPVTLANAWREVEISTASFGLEAFSGFAWQDARGSAQPVYYLDDIQLVKGTPPPADPPVLTIDVAANRRPISPYIYGWNFANSAIASELQLPVNRWGGNATTRYNWKLDTSNRASDWYFENIPDSNPNPGQLPNGSNTDRFVEGNITTGADSIVTVPLIGWTPKSRAYACGFSVAKYGAQESTDPWRSDCGNGKRKSDGSLITGNDPADTSIAIGPDFVGDWVNHLVSRYGRAGSGGVRFYNLDNEPMLWNSTHRDVHPAPATYDEMITRTIQHAGAIKAADPGALTLGPVVWGWCAYFYSAADNCGRGSDYSSHGNVHFVPWYLRQLQTYEQQYGVRLLDYLDMHYYPQASGVSLSSVGDATTQALRLRSTRSLWDPTYVDESWINQVVDGPYVRLIPRMREWVNANYPGTKLAITEYNWGAHDHINGALAQADVLGIFGREGLDLATLWDPPGSSEPAAFAFRIFRNYDAAGAKFGETSVRGASTDQGRVSVYAAMRSDNRLTAVLINKTAEQLTSTLTIGNYTAGASARVYRYSPADLTHIVRQADLPIAAGAASVTMPASSITLLVVPPMLVPSDFNRDGDVDLDDFEHLRTCHTGPGVIPPTAGCDDADLDDDQDVDQSDFGLMQRCFSGANVAADPACVN